MSGHREYRSQKDRGQNAGRRFFSRRLGRTPERRYKPQYPVPESRFGRPATHASFAMVAPMTDGENDWRRGLNAGTMAQRKRRRAVQMPAIRVAGLQG